MQAASRTSYLRITVICITNRLHFCVIFFYPNLIYECGHITQPGGPRVGHPSAKITQQQTGWRYILWHHATYAKVEPVFNSENTYEFKLPTGIDSPYQQRPVGGTENYIAFFCPLPHVISNSVQWSGKGGGRGADPEYVYNLFYKLRTKVHIININVHNTVCYCIYTHTNTTTCSITRLV
jgi:hypothetical protein